MPNAGLKTVASSECVKIRCPESGRFSFFNSPYPAHQSYSGIDIYPKNSFGDIAPSPFKGEVTAIRRVKCPDGKNFQGTDYDFVTLLHSLENPERWIKVLHVEPVVKVGDIVSIGDALGRLIRSGFFDFWTDPHIHVEVRLPSDPLRARGGFKFERLMGIHNTGPATRELRGKVIESKQEYVMVALNENPQHGVTVEVDGRVGLLDAGIPHYRWFGVHMNTKPPTGAAVKLCGRKIGIVRYAYSNMGLAEYYGPSFAVNGEPVGLSLYLWPFASPLVKIIPQRLGRLVCRKSEELSVAIF